MIEPQPNPPLQSTPREEPGIAPDAGDPPGGVRRRALPWLRAALVIVLVIVLDQLTKRQVEQSIVPGEEKKFLPGIELVNTRNHGVAFGFLPGNHIAVTILVSLALLALVVYFALHATQHLMWLPTGMLIGGALGNILDRLRHGSVTDFIKLPLGWPPFNLADSSITVGIVILFLLVDRARHAERSAQGR